MGRRDEGHVRRMLDAAGGSGPRATAHPVPRARAYVPRWLALLVALIAALGVVFAGGAQARKASPQHVIVKLSCTKVTFLYLGFPEGVTNSVHQKVKVAGKVINNYKAPTSFFGSIAETEVPVEIPATGEYLIQAGATWNTNEVVGESSTTTNESLTCIGTGHAAFSIEKEQRIAGEATYTPEELHAKVGQIVEYHVIVKNTGDKTLSVHELPGPQLRKTQKHPDQRTGAARSRHDLLPTHAQRASGSTPTKPRSKATKGTGKESSNTVKVDVPPNRPSR